MSPRRDTHPSAAWRPDLDRLRDRLADELRRRDAPWPELGAAALVARGLAGADLEHWSRATGVGEEVVADVERGCRAAGDIPPGLLVWLPPAAGGTAAG
jgi:hypothetical protein